VFNNTFLFSSKNDFVDWVNLAKYPEALYLLPGKGDGPVSDATPASGFKTVQNVPHIKLYEHPVNQRQIIRKENKNY
jgi:hypothetical protein